MPPENLNEQEIQFKKRARRRLVGAIALVLLMVTILPMVLDDRSNKTPPQEVAITIPSQDGGEFTSKIVPVAPEVQPAKTAVIEEVPPLEKPVPPVSKPVESPAQPLPEKDLTVHKVQPETVSQKNAYSVQIGVFSDPANVKQLQEKLSSQGQKSYTEKMATANGEKIRLRAGPFASKEEAEQALGAIKNAGLSGILVGNK